MRVWQGRNCIVQARACKHPRVHVRAVRAHRSLEGAHLLAQVSELASQCHLPLPQLLIFCLRASIDPHQQPRTSSSRQKNPQNLSLLC